MSGSHRWGGAVLPLVLAVLFPTAPSADTPQAGIELEEGLWVFEVSTQAPLRPPTHQTLQHCVAEGPITVKELMPWAEAQGCEIRRAKARKNKLTWKLRCSINGQSSKGRGKFTTDGEVGDGKATVDVYMGGRKLAIVTRWDAKRVSACSQGSSSDLPRRLGSEEQD